jgi:hypothetical protein
MSSMDFIDLPLGPGDHLAMSGTEVKMLSSKPPFCAIL